MQQAQFIVAGISSLLLSSLVARALQVPWLLLNAGGLDINGTSFAQVISLEGV